MPLGNLIHVFNLGGEVVLKRQFQFCVNVIRKLTTGQVVLGTNSGLYLIDALTVIKLNDGKYCDIDTYGKLFCALDWESRQVVTFVYDLYGIRIQTAVRVHCGQK